MDGCQDTIQYWLFPVEAESNTAVTDVQQLQSYCTLYLTHLHQYIQPYIWNQDPFNLKAVQKNVGEGLEGKFIYFNIVYGIYSKL